ncbi:hypothetical protein ES705_26165 [subsurface metagenome]
MKKYYWQDLPQEIKDDFFEAMKGTDEKKDDYVNRHNSPQTLGDWEYTIRKQKEG